MTIPAFAATPKLDIEVPQISKTQLNLTLDEKLEKAVLDPQRCEDKHESDAAYIRPRCSHDDEIRRTPMFEIKKDKTICLTRGDVASIVVSANLSDGKNYTFQPGDVVRLLVCKRRAVTEVMLRKDVTIEQESKTATIRLTKEDTRFGDVISKPVDYWYEIELNPDTNPQTIIGYDSAGEKIFRLYPEGGGAEWQ